MPISVPQQDVSGVLPASFAVRFPSRICPGGCVPKGGQKPPKWYVSTVQFATLFPNSFKDHPGTWTVHDRCPALYDGVTSLPTNQAALDALAKQAARDFYNWRTLSYDLVYNGIISPTLDASVDTLEISYSGGGVTTRLTSAPWDGEPEEFFRLGSSCDYPDPVVYIPSASSSGGFLHFPTASISRNLSDIFTCESSEDTVKECCSGGPPCGKFCVVVKDVCGNIVVGASVTWSDGKNTRTCTTDAGGVCCVNDFPLGTYTLTVDGGDEYITYSHNYTVSSCDPTGDNIILDLAPGWNCFPTGGGCYPFCKPSPFPDIPTVLFLNDGFGIVTLTLTDPLLFIYNGCEDRPSTFAYTPNPTACIFSQVVSGTVAVYYQFQCISSFPGPATWKVTVSVARTNPGSISGICCFPVVGSCGDTLLCGGALVVIGFSNISAITHCLPGMAWSDTASCQVGDDQQWNGIFGPGPIPGSCSTVTFSVIQ